MNKKLIRGFSILYINKFLYVNLLLIKKSFNILEHKTI